MKLLKVAVAVMFSLSFSSESFAVGSGALGNQTVATKATSHGFAFAGVADDASAIFYNPAGLTQVKGFEAIIGAAFVDFDTEHKGSATGVTTSMDSDSVTVPHGYFSYSGVDSKWAFGVAVNSPFGLLTDWADTSFSSLHATESTLLMYNINPTVSYEVTPKFSVGFGLDYFNVHDVELKSRPPFGLSGFTPVPTETSISGDGAAWGYNAGVHWKTNEQHSFGLSYRSQVSALIEGEMKFENAAALGLAPGSQVAAETVIKFPQSVLLGYGFKPSEKWSLFVDYEWVNWNVVDKTEVSLAQSITSIGNTVITDRKWDNSNNFSVGTEYGASEMVDLRGGLGWYDQVIPDETLETQIPSAGRWFLTLGTGLNFGKTSVDLGYTAVFLDDRTVNNTQGNALGADLDGTYETFINIFHVGLKQKWGGDN